MPRLAYFPAKHSSPKLGKIHSSLPATLKEIRQAASSMFSDPAVISVEVEAFFGLVTVDRNGQVKMA